MKKVIAHEMIHARQYVNQELQIVKEFKVLWKEQAIHDYRYIDYDKRGWEHEAFSQTSYLVKLFNKMNADDAANSRIARDTN